MLAGVYTAKKKNGEIYYRASFNYRAKHISLGSFQSEFLAHTAYKEAISIVNDMSITIDNYEIKHQVLNFEKWVILINFRDNNYYIKTPIYLKKSFFYYYISEDDILKFDIDDLFYYSNHKIMRRGRHLFISDFGMQVNILNRYGIKNYAIQNRDYIFVNGDSCDYRYCNIKILNRYMGVEKKFKNNKEIYVTKIHINGNYLVGIYNTEEEAAIAYNKAIDFLIQNGVKKNYQKNYIYDIDERQYSILYNKINISKKIREKRYLKNI